MSDISIPAGAPVSSCGRMQSVCAEFRGLEQPWRSDGRAAHTPELRTPDAWNPITLHIRVHPIIGQDDADVDAAPQGHGGGRHSFLGGTAKDRWDYIVAVSDAEIEEPRSARDASRSRGRLVWETALIDGRLRRRKKGL
jgi:hypothetical protein